MPEIRIEPATSDRFDDLQHALSGGGDGRGCQCQWWTLRNVEWEATTLDGRADLLHDETTTDPVPGLIAYVDDEPAGWVRVGARPGFARLRHSRVIAPHSPTSWDDPAEWSVNCFVVRKEHRRQGLTPALLDAAIAFARDHGAGAIEAYPIDTAVTKKSSNDLYTGVLSVFEAAGFHEVARPKPHLAIVRLELGA